MPEMLNQNSIVRIFLLLITVTACSSLAMGKDSLWEEKANAQIQFQKNLAQLLTKEIPEAKDAILNQRDWQICLINQRTEEYYYVLKNAPTAIHTKQGVIQWSNFDWANTYEEQMLKSNQKYKKLKAECDTLSNKHKNNQQALAGAREKFSTIEKTEAYQKIHHDLMTTFDRIDKKLKIR